MYVSSICDFETYVLHSLSLKCNQELSVLVTGVHVQKMYLPMSVSKVKNNVTNF